MKDVQQFFRQRHGDRGGPRGGAGEAARNIGKTEPRRTRGRAVEDQAETAEETDLELETGTELQGAIDLCHHPLQRRLGQGTARLGSEGDDV